MTVMGEREKRDILTLSVSDGYFVRLLLEYS